MRTKKNPTQLYNAIYEVVKGKDQTVMRRMIFDKFKKRDISKLSNEQLETLLTALEEHYAKQS